MKYPPYACRHCGIANADMFYDWHIHTHNTEPTKEDWDAFQAYRQLYEAYKEQEKWQNNITDGKPTSSAEGLRRYRKLKKGGKNESW